MQEWLNWHAWRACDRLKRSVGSNPTLSAYVLWSEELRKRYIGSTENLQKRIKEHNAGKSKFTKSGIPWNLIYYETFEEKKDALQREMFLKSGQGRKILDSILQNGDRGFSAEG